MTAAEAAEFIALWTEGLSLKDIGARLGIPRGTVSSRAAALRRQGVALDKRPQGGAYPSRRAKARQSLALSEASEIPPVHTSVHTPVQRPVHTPLDPSPGSPDLEGVLNALVERLSAIEETLKHGGVQSSTPVQDYAPVQAYTPVQSYALPGVEPPKLSPEERKSERWNIYMPRWIRQRIERAAALEGMSPSQFLQRLCGPWAATWQEPPEATP